MKRALVVGAAPVRGADAFYRDLLARFELVVAADAGGEWCASLGRVPDATVGDFDSAEPGAAGRLARMGSSVVSAPPAKDDSDLELCARHARSQGVRDLCFTACTTDRLDHTLAALGTVMRCADLGAWLSEPSWTAWTVGGGGPRSRRIVMGTGTTFSVMAPAGASGVSVGGGRYPLTDGVLPPLSDLGLSNVANTPSVTVTVRDGVLLVISWSPDGARSV